MASKSNPHRGGCCVTPVSCVACQDNLPRYLCFHADIVTHEGTGTSGGGTGTGTSDVPCCLELNSRLVPYGGGDCGWFASDIQCSDGSADIGSVVVELVHETTGTGTGTGCITRVTADGHVFDFSGVLPVMEFSFIKNRIQYNCIVRHSHVVPNPAAFGKCPVCSCVTCIPEFLCVRILTTEGTGNAVATWNCSDVEWSCPDITIGAVTGTGTGTTPGKTYSVSLRMSRSVDGVGCAVIGTVSGAGTSSFVIALESDVSGSEYKGVTCNERGGSASRGVTPKADVVVDTVLNYSASITGPTGTGSSVDGTVYITDKSCEQVCTPCRCCPGMPDTFYVSVDTACLYGVLTLRLTFIDPLAGTSIWTCSGSLTSLNCDTVFPFTEHMDPLPVFATGQCVLHAPGFAVSIGDATGNVFSITVPSCDGGTVNYNDPGVSNWTVGGTCCALYGIGLNGSITVSP